jgi:hypothetical protein
MANGKRSNGGGARDPKQVARLVRSVVDSKLEHKYFDNVTTTYNSFGGATAGILHWTPVPQGTAAGERVGTRIDPVKFSFRYDALLNGGSIRRARLILFQWMMNDNTSVPTAGDILQNTTTAKELLCSQYRIVMNRQFHILLDESFTINPTTYTSVHGQRTFKNLRKMSYDAGATFGIGQIYSMWVLDSPLSPGDLDVDMGARLEFTDA